MSFNGETQRYRSEAEHHVLLFSRTKGTIYFHKSNNKEKKGAGLLPLWAAPCVPFEVCCEFPGCEKCIYRALTARSGTEKLSPQGQLNKWQKAHIPAGSRATKLPPFGGRDRSSWQEILLRKSCFLVTSCAVIYIYIYFQKQSIF